MATVHGIYWMVTPGQDTKSLDLGWGKRQPDRDYCVKVRTIEALLPFDEGGVQFPSARYFKRKEIKQ